METSSQTSTSDEPPYRTYKQLRIDDVGVEFIPAMKRLFWPLEGVFPNAISVMKTAYTPDDIEPFFRPDAEGPGGGGGGGGGGTWHDIALQPLTEPKLSSIDVFVAELEEWEYDWVEWHAWHAGSDSNAEFVTYGDLDDDVRPYAREAKEDGSWEEDSDTEFLLRCCGDDRPVRRRGIKLTVTPAPDGDGFVTVRDYISAVHPWLMSFRDDIVEAKKVAGPEHQPDLWTDAWMVKRDSESFLGLRIQDKVGWLMDHTAPRYPRTPAEYREKLRVIRTQVHGPLDEPMGPQVAVLYST